jgi:poly(3-hydroxybutyrate) depolymerase
MRTDSLSTWLAGLAAGLMVLSCGGAGEDPGTGAGELASLPPIDATAVTVSGVSSGAAMAQQLHLAYGDRFSGAGLLAGVPYACAEGSIQVALGRCMGHGEEPLPVADFLAALDDAAARGQASDPALLAAHRVWLFHGAKDEAVGRKAADATAAIYEAHVPEENLVYVTDVDAAHHFPTLAAGNACDVSAEPWLGACDYDAAGELLSHLYPGLTPPSDGDRAAGSGEGLRETVLPGADDAGLDDSAWLFVPEQCPPAGCRLHLVLHGCAMSVAKNGMSFIEDSGYLPWARANGIVLAFPQVDTALLNPLGCWDWWGYNSDNYFDRDGTQLKTLADWVADLAGS